MSDRTVILNIPRLAARLGAVALPMSGLFVSVPTKCLLIRTPIGLWLWPLVDETESTPGWDKKRGKP